MGPVALSTVARNHGDLWAKSPAPVTSLPRPFSQRTAPTAANPHLADAWLAEQCADHLETNRLAVLEILTAHESHETAEEDLASSIDTLRNVHRELAYLRRATMPTISVFLPINLPLYSLILFAAIPSLMADRVDVRLPAATPDWVSAVAAAAGFDRFFPRVHLLRVTRRQFIEDYASHASVVVFTGRPEAAEEVRAECPFGVFIFQGSGVNPIVIGPNAELSDDVIEQIITTRIFNGGQDCAAPDAFLIHTSKAAEFVETLVDQVRTWPLGSYDDPKVRIGPILNRQALPALEERLNALRADTVIGGNVDRATGLVDPTVVVRPLAEHDELTEFFAPIFYVLVYEGDHDLAAFFNRREYADNAMYVSLFGQDPVPGLFESSTVLFNRTVLDVEQGNTAFGGNGPKANYVVLGGKNVIVGPALISETLARSTGV